MATTNTMTEESPLLLQTNAPSPDAGGGDEKNWKSKEQLPCLVTLLRQGAILSNKGSTARDHLANERSEWLSG
jgi:hypothetical protein